MSVLVADSIQEALLAGEPIVALETAVLTAGLPKTPWNTTFGDCPTYIDREKPINIALAQSMSHAIQANGAIPAWIAVIDGTLRIGLTEEECIQLASNTNAGKVSLATIAQTMQCKQSAGTTVATTLLACRLASEKNPIRFFATGGIGGIHQNWASRLDISADLTALATTQTCVIASGAKSILDIHATVESLETIGVPVLGLGNGTFPRFIEKNRENDPTVLQVHLPIEIANICKHHWHELHLQSGVLATVPVPENVALEQGALDESLKQAEERWAMANQPSSTRTPFLLDSMAKSTQGKSLIANLALLSNNAKEAANIAVSFASKL
jgi:pseudouridine-5'-phosphate glycosidase